MSRQPISSRRLIATLALAVVIILPQTAGAQSVTKDTLLRNTVSKIIVPAYQDLAGKIHALSDSVDDFTKAPTTDSLRKAREAWVAASLASRKIQWLQSGPIADRDYQASFYYAKILPGRIDEVLKASAAINAAYIEELGATVKGMFALEYLLFDRIEEAIREESTKSSVLELYSRPEAARRRQYAVALAHDLDVKAGQLVKEWTTPGDQGAAEKFTAGGQETLNRIVNHLAQLLEQVAEQRINFVLQLQPPLSRQFDRIEGSRSGTSLQSAIALLHGAQKLYQGTDGEGLEGYLKGLNAPLAERSRLQFETVIAAVQGIGAPLEQVVPKNRAPVEAAYEKTRSLEVLCKTDLPSTLGVTITFSSNDGD